jgi:hypothetical protein
MIFFIMLSMTKKRDRFEVTRDSISTGFGMLKVPSLFLYELAYTNAMAGMGTRVQ